MKTDIKYYLAIYGWDSFLVRGKPNRYCLSGQYEKIYYHSRLTPEQKKMISPTGGPPSYEFGKLRWL